MYTWESSPSCKKAIEAFEIINANVKIVRLDDPWTEGNPIRAVLGRKIGRSSVPFIFINGKYIGGYDGGIEDDNDASGMLNLAFQGKLRDMLNDAGAMN
jgi:glutaredoxin